MGLLGLILCFLFQLLNEFVTWGPQVPVEQPGYCKISLNQIYLNHQVKRRNCSSLVFFFQLPCLSKNKRVLVVAWIQTVRGNHLNFSFSNMRSHILKTNLGSKFILDRVSGKTKHVDHHIGADLESTKFLVDTKEQSDNRWCYNLEWEKIWHQGKTAKKSSLIDLSNW